MSDVLGSLSFFNDVGGSVHQLQCIFRPSLSIRILAVALAPVGAYLVLLPLIYSVLRRCERGAPSAEPLSNVSDTKEKQSEAHVKSRSDANHSNVPDEGHTIVADATDKHSDAWDTALTLSNIMVFIFLPSCVRSFGVVCVC